jgi:integrase
VLHSAFDEAKRHGLASRNPADSVDLPRKVRDTKKQFLTPEETTKFVGKLGDSDLADLFAFMISTGTRLGEATGVRWQDIDLSVPNRPMVWIRGQLQRLDNGLVYVQGTKTNQWRCLPLSSPVADRLKDLQARRLLGDVCDPDGIVFSNAEGRRLDQKHVSSRLTELCVKAEIPPISPHKLRHTAATLALAETGDLHGVQKMLGHSQVSLTSDLYGHATAETLRPISNAIEKAMRHG